MLFKEPRYKEWLENANFDNCKLNRKEFGEFLANYLVGEKDGFVLNLNGAWGTGKTEFCKRLYSHLITNDHPTIYINSWESDFSKEPLTVVSSELLRQMEALHSDVVGLKKTEEIKKILGKTLKSLAVGVAGAVSYKLIGESSAGTAVMQQIVQQDIPPQDFIDKLATNYSEQVDSIQFIRETLTELALALEIEINAKLPVVVIIDELDRCRPNYAIEMLEVIKHFFSTKNFVFVVATDTEQLCQSIKNIYGNKFNSNQYLKRFFDRTATLPLPNIKEYIDSLNFELNDDDIYGLMLYPAIGEDNYSKKSIINILSAFSEGFNFKVRDVDQLLNKVYSCLRTASAYQKNKSIKLAINFPILVCGLIEYEIGAQSFYERTNRKKSMPTLINNNVNITQEVTLSTLIDMSLFGTTELLVGNDYGGEYYSLPVGSNWNYENWDGHNPSAEIRNLCNRIKNINSATVQRSIDFWRWSEYRKVIELAGYLE
ncbi:hypothetical protein HUO09_10140 [Vibrio sp. Y2-5]|uniref:KAP family P-loop NTPase fold protein n=1 Tax=Vibrio sp. Y2-5 TaxID=2743977 RepID=UPI0016608CA9|nr:P-loop NTPase fold protein [Vibrio sp. Y2-5]MBD0786708.1 hypothetical protein [Vibrio sp. Y2-5]